jgi:hypothetical protein
MSALIFACLIPPVAAAAEGGSLLSAQTQTLTLRLEAEGGILAPFAHTIQFGKGATTFDYVEEGGQDVLFPFARLAAGVGAGRETFTLLYQPLDLRTEVVLRRDLEVDTVSFPAGSPIDLRYGFSFWRGTWGHDLLASPERELSVGLALQLRDAQISFTSADGATRFAEQDVGPVPLLHARLQIPATAGTFVGAEASGVYAPIKYLNGSNVDVVGSLLDASVRAGMELPHGAEAFVGLRYIGGGAEGTGKDSEAFGDGYSANWLHFGTVTVGATLR